MAGAVVSRDVPRWASRGRVPLEGRLSSYAVEVETTNELMSTALMTLCYFSELQINNAMSRLSFIHRTQRCLSVCLSLTQGSHYVDLAGLELAM